MKFLSGKESSSAIRKAMRTGGQASFAVAYWGDGAINQLGLSRRRKEKTRIICDLLSGACNPSVIRQLVEGPNIEVRTRAGLHAKVYICPGLLIVGSSNASADGLSSEIDVTERIEANVQSRDPGTLEEIQAWFDDIWDKASCVGAPLLDEVQADWKRRQQHATTRLKAPTVLDQLKRNGWAGRRDIRVVAYQSEPPSRAAMRAYNLLGRSPRSSRKVGSVNPFFEMSTDWPVEPGNNLICFSTPRRRLSSEGIWRVPDNEPFILMEQLQRGQARTGAGKSHLVLLQEMSDLEGFRFPNGERDLLCGKLRNWIEAHDWQLDGHGSFFDKPLHEAWEMLRRF